MAETAPSLPTADSFKYWAFISYSHKDKSWADWLHRAIETYKIPTRLTAKPGRDGEVPKRLFPVFRDRDELPTSGNLSTNIQGAIRGSRYLIVICSPHSAMSRWVDEEIKAFKALGREDRILCLIVDGEPNASDKEPPSLQECFAPALRFRAGPEGALTKERAEPIAADAREGQDGRTNALLKVVAGLLGVGFDELKQRDQQRRQRQRLLMVSAAFAVIALFAGTWMWQERAKNIGLSKQLAFAYLVRADALFQAGDFATAAAYAAEANRLSPSHLARADALAWTAKLAKVRQVFAHSEDVKAVAFSPDGKTVVTGGSDRTARLWNAGTGLAIGAAMPHPFAGVNAVAFSPDGTAVLTRSSRIARLWDARSGKPISDEMHHAAVGASGSLVRQAAFSPDGKLIVTAGDDGIARLWRTRDGVPIGRIMKHEEAINAVAFSPDGRTILTGSHDATARLWDSETGLPIGRLMRHKSPVQAVAFSPDGRSLIAGTYNGAFLWNAHGGALGQLKGYVDAEVDAVAFSPDGKLVLTAGALEPARLWDAGSRVPLGGEMRHAKNIYSVAFNPDGSAVLTGSGDKTARIWAAPEGTPLGEELRHDGAVNAAVFSPDGQTVLTGSSDKMARLWDAHPRRPPFAALEEGGAQAVAVSLDGKILLTVSSDTVKSWDARTLTPLGVPMRHEKGAGSFALSPDGQTVVVRGKDGSVRSWDVRTGRELFRLPGRKDGVFALAFSPDSARLATGTEEGEVNFWTTRTGQSAGRAMRVGSSVESISFSPDGRMVLTQAYSARAWNAITNDPIGREMAHSHSITAAVLSPDGKMVLTGGFDDTARLWDARSGAPVGKVMRHEKKVDSVSFSADGRTILTRSEWGHEARLWDAQTGEPIGKVIKADQNLSAAIFSPNGKTIAAGFAQSPLRLFDARTGEPLGTVMDRDSSIRSIAFSPDGRTIFSTGYSGKVWRWDVPWLVDDISPEQLVLHAQWAGFRRINELGDSEILSAEDWRGARRRLGIPDVEPATPQTSHPPHPR